MISLTRKEKEAVNKNYRKINQLKSKFFPQQVLRKNDKLLLDFYFIACSIFKKIDQPISIENKTHCLQLFEEILVKSSYDTILHSKTAIKLYKYYLTRNTEADRRKAFSYLHRISKSFYTSLMYYHLGIDFEMGINIKKNTIAAFKCYCKAANENQYDSALNIALLIYRDKAVQNYLVEENFDAMILSNRCLLGAADPEQGNLPEAQYVLALNYLRRENLLAIDELSFYQSICLGTNWLYLSYKQHYPAAKEYISKIMSSVSRGESHDLSDMPRYCIPFILGEFNFILTSLVNFSEYFLKAMQCYLLAIHYGMDEAKKQLEICYQHLLMEDSPHPIAVRKYFLAQFFLSDIYKFIPEIQHISCNEALQQAMDYLQAASMLDYTPLTSYRRLIPAYASDNNSIHNFFVKKEDEDKKDEAKKEDDAKKKIYEFKQRSDPFFQANYFLFKRHCNQFSKQFYQFHPIPPNSEDDPALPKPAF